MSEQNRRRLLSTAGAFLVAAILMTLNVLALHFYVRADLSEGRIYSLGKASGQVLSRLEDPVYITAYFSPELPPQYSMVRDYLERLLKEYANTSKGKVRFEFYAAEPDKFREAAMKEGIQPVRFNIIEKERYEVREGFLGVVVKYLDKREVMPVVQDPTGLEYDLTGRMKKMMRARKKVIGVVASHGAMKLDAIPEGVRAKLLESYEEKAVDLSDPASSLDGVDALMLFGPENRLDDHAVFLLDQALLAGKPVALALDTKSIDKRQFMGSPLDLGLDGWLRHAGLTLRKNLVLDLQNQRVSVTSQQGWMQVTNIVDYPPFVVATTISGEHPATKGLDSLSFPWVSPVEISSAPGLSATALASSSRRSWMRSDWERQFSRMSPFEPMAPTAEDPKGPFVLGAAVEGKFTGYFPAPPKKSTSVVSGVEPFLKESKGTGRLLVLGTSRFIQKDIPLPDTNVVFFLNLVDWLAQDSEMAAIRSKAVAYRPLREIPPQAKTAIKYADLFAGPAAVVALGLVRWRRRKTRIAQRTALYGA